ncbi:MAG: S-layer homology domain-containing protein [Pseudomonadota bacterium]
MKHLRKSMLLILALILAIAPTNVQAAGSFSYESEAQMLNSLGLYSGISGTGFDPDLGAALNRETGVVMLLRIFGLEADALALTDAEVNRALAGFSDASSVSSWAKRQVAYAVQNGLVQGLPDGTFAPKTNLVGKAYCTLILRQLGYTPNYDTAAAELANAGGLTANQAMVFSGKALIKDDLVGISFGSLSARGADGATVIDNLVADKVVDEKAVVDAGLMDSQILAAAEAAVAAYEAAPLTTIAEIEAAEALRLKAIELLALVPDADAKAALEAKVAAQKTRSDTAKAGLAQRSSNDRDSHHDEDSDPSVAITGLGSSPIYINGFSDDYLLPFSVSPTNSVVDAVYGNNIPFGDSLRSEENEPGSYYLYFGNFEDGTYTITITATKSGYDQGTRTKEVVVDSTAPDISDSHIDENPVGLDILSTETGTYYYLVREYDYQKTEDEQKPDVGTIKAQRTGTGSVTNIETGNKINIPGLTPNIEYRLYLVVEDAAGNISTINDMPIMISSF